LKDLVIDLGGTKARMAFATNGSVDWNSVKDIPSNEHPSMTSAILAYFNDLNMNSSLKIDGISVGIAGPVSGDTAEVTNLGWTITKNSLKENLSNFEIKRVELLNDLEAFAWGVIGLNTEELSAINTGKVQSGNKGVVAAGTGLGMAGIVEAANGKLFPFATEGGHTTFVPRSGDEKLLKLLSEKYNGHVSFERVVSGKFGFQNLFEVYSKDFSDKEKDAFNIESGNWGAESARLARENNPLAIKIIDSFLYYYGVVAANFALMQKATGGIFIAGGIAPKIKDLLLTRPSFMEGYLYKGRFSDFLKDIPVYLVEDDKSALLGSANYLQSARS
jgi:glucokinase